MDRAVNVDRGANVRNASLQRNLDMRQMNRLENRLGRLEVVEPRPQVVEPRPQVVEPPRPMNVERVPEVVPQIGIRLELADRLAEIDENLRRMNAQIEARAAEPRNNQNREVLAGEIQQRAQLELRRNNIIENNQAMMQPNGMNQEPIGVGAGVQAPQGAVIS